MANLINPSFSTPNIYGAIQQGMQDGRNMAHQRRQDADRSQLRNLSSGILAGDPNAFMQAAAIDPDAAMNMQSAGDNQLRRLEGGLNFLDNALSTNNPASINAAYQQVRPFLQRFTGTEGPEQWDESMRQGMEQVRAKIAMAKSGQFGTGPAGYQEFNLMTQGLTPEDRIKAQRINLGLDPRQSSAAITYQKFRGEDGIERLIAVDPRNPSAQVIDSIPAQNQNPQTSPQVNFTMSDGTPIDISTVSDPVVRAQIAANPDAFGMVPDNSLVQLPAVDVNQFTNRGQVASPLRGRRPEDEEAAKVSARLAAENANFQNELDQTRQLEAVKGQASVDQAIQTERGKAQVERELAAPSSIATLQQSLDSIDALLESPNLKSIVGIRSLNPMNLVAGTEARGLIARADQIAGQAFLAAFNQLKGGGAITEREGTAATAAMARLDRSQSEDDYKAALRDLKAAISPAIERQKAALARGQQSPSPARVSNQSDYDALPSGSLYVDPQGNQRRKR